MCIRDSIFSNAAGHRWKIWTWRAGEGGRADGIESPKGSVVLKFWRSKRCRKWIYNTVTSNDLMLGDGAPKKKYVIQLRTGLNMIAQHWNVRCGGKSAHEMLSWTTRNAVINEVCEGLLVLEWECGNYYRQWGGVHFIFDYRSYRFMMFDGHCGRRSGSGDGGIRDRDGWNEYGTKSIAAMVVFRRL